MFRPYRVPVLAVLLLSLSVSGCQQKLTPPRTVPVSGTVMLNGKPASGVRVKFHPQFNIGRTKYVPYGETGKDGMFSLSTGGPGNGAPQGDYIVTMEMPRIESGREDGLEAEVDQFQGAFSDPEKSQWKVNVKAGENVLEPFNLNVSSSAPAKG